MDWFEGGWMAGRETIITFLEYSWATLWTHFQKNNRILKLIQPFTRDLVIQMVEISSPLRGQK